MSLRGATGLFQKRLSQIKLPTKDVYGFKGYLKSDGPAFHSLENQSSGTIRPCGYRSPVNCQRLECFGFAFVHNVLFHGGLSHSLVRQATTFVKYTIAPGARNGGRVLHLRAIMDHVSFDGATALAGRIREYWTERGYEVRTYVDSLAYRNGVDGIIYTVRTDMIGGLPQRQREQKAA